MNKKLGLMVSAALLAMGSQAAMAACSDITPLLDGAITTATGVTNALNSSGLTGADGGYPLKFWITVVDETGMVCAVKTNGTPGKLAGNSEWLGSRVISAQKANTANLFSLDNYTISTANLFTPVQPGNSLYGLQHSNPIDASRAYGGSPNTYGTNADYLKNKRIGGVNVFGGGLALYHGGHKVGAVGVSGDTSCADHLFAWQVRKALGMQPLSNMNSALGDPGDAIGITTVNLLVPTGTDTNDSTFSTPLAGAVQGDEMIIDGDTPNAYWSNWRHAACPNTFVGLEGIIVNGTLNPTPPAP